VRGQSETIGFVLVFALIVASTGVVYVAGFSSLDDARAAEEITNAERAFDVFDDNVQDVTRRGAPSRATEMSLGNGDLYLENATRITVTGHYASNGTEGANASVGARPIVYRLDGSRVVYASGAVIRSDRGNAVMRTQPSWVVTDRRTVLPLVVTNPDTDGRTAVGGGDTVLIAAERTERTLGIEFDPRTTAVNVTVTVKSPRAEAWGQFLADRGFTAIDADASDDRVSYWFVTDELYLQRTSIRIGFQP
jgi:hypothetical protein